MTPDTYTVYLAIAVTAVTVYATRLAGYVGGRVIRLDGRTRRIVNALPGCALAAIVAPAVMRGSLLDVVIIVGTLALYIWSRSILISLILGVTLCVASGHYTAGTFA